MSRQMKHALVIWWLAGTVFVFGGLYTNFTQDCRQEYDCRQAVIVGRSVFASAVWPAWVPLYLSVKAWERAYAK